MHSPVLPKATSQPPPSELQQDRDASKFIVEILIGMAMVGDLVAFLAGLLLAFHLRFNVLPHWLGPTTVTFQDYIGHFIFGTILFLVLATRSGMYARQNILRARKVKIDLLNMAAYWTGVYLFFSCLFNFTPPTSRIFVICGIFGGAFLVFIWRYLFHLFLLQEPVSVRIRQRILVVGWNVEATRLAASVFSDPRHPYEIVGCLPSANDEYRVEPPKQVRRLGDYNHIQEILGTTRVDVVLIADLDPKTREIIALCEYCNRELIPFKIIPTYFQILLSGLHLETISGVPVLGVAKLPLDSAINRTIKRTIDIIGGIVGLIITVPILLIFGTLIYLESPGPIIYRQIRKGREGRPFVIYKIRSMKLDAEKNGPQWSKEKDDRCLKVGAFLRKWNLDEFPQFWNVLKSEMSLVGPRPERPELIENFKDQIRHYNARHYVKPGVTGWAQIHGLRGDTDLNERIRYDLFYLENWSPMLDFYVMMRTLYKNKKVVPLESY
jgi:exopolysaccharide biosynthesis polyprenyl glycosylphosphotransferase